MTKSQLGLFGSLLAAGALAMVGCGGGGTNGGTGGSGSGGRGGAGTGGRGGAGTGGRMDGGTTTDAGTDVRTDTGTAGTTGTGGSDAGTGDTGPADTGPCVTSIGADNQLLFSFDTGSNVGWIPEVSAVGYTFSGTRTDGDRCPGAISLTVNFSSFSNPPADVVYKYGTAGNWTGFSKLHASVKIVTSTFAAVNGVQPFVQSNNYGSYANGGFASASTFTDGRFHEVVLDMLHPGFGTVVFNSITQFGIQILLFSSATDGGPSAPTDVQLLIDDVWLEATPPTPDAGPEVGPDASPDVAPDTSPDVPTDAPGTDATTG